MFVVAVDIETTGLDPKLNQITEIGLVAGDIHKPKSVKRYKLQVWPEGFNWSIYCLQLHQQYLKRVIQFQEQMTKKIMEFEDGPFVLPHMVSGLVKTWLKENCGDPKYVAAGKNFGRFDARFLKEIDLEDSIFKVRSLDPTLMYVTPGDKVPPELAICKERAITAGSKEISHSKVTHDALDDAEDVWNLLHFKAFETGA